MSKTAMAIESRDDRVRLRHQFTNEVIRAIGVLARQQHVCREQGGRVAFVTGMDAAREYVVEQVRVALTPSEHTCQDMNPPFPGPCAACAREQHESKLEQSLEHVLYLLDELYALVNGECPSLLDEDRGGDASLDAKIARALLLKGQP